MPQKKHANWNTQNTGKSIQERNTRLTLPTLDHEITETRKSPGNFHLPQTIGCAHDFYGLA